MALSWDNLHAAIDADDVDAVEKLILAATENDRRARWPQVEALTDYSKERQERRHDLRDSGLKLAIVGTARGAEQLAATYWRAWASEHTGRRAATLLATRNPSWLPQVVRALLSDDWLGSWRLARQLIRLGTVAQPDNREEYVRRMIGQLRERTMTLREALLEDAGLLDREVYELFEHDSCAATLAAHDHWVTHRWDHDTRRSVASTERDPHAESWGQVLADLAGEGRLDRQRLLDLALAALVRDTTWSRKVWHAGFLDLLSPTVDEIADRAGSYLALLAAGDGPSVGLGQAAVRTLLAADRLRPDELLPVAGAPLLRKEKAVALRQLKLLDGLAADPAWTAEVVTAMATAFGHPRPDVQERALKLVARHLPSLAAEVVDQLRDAAGACAPSLAAEVQKVFGAVPTPATEIDLPLWEPPPPTTLPPPLTDDAEFVEAAVSIMGGDRDARLFERVIEGLLARVGRAPDGLADGLSPAVAAARKAIRTYDPHRAFVAAGVLLLVGERRSGPWFDTAKITPPRAPSPLARRLEEVLARLDRGHGGPWLSMPTDPAGRVDPAVLAERRRQLGEIDAQLVTADTSVAEARAGIVRESSPRSPLPDWHAPDTYRWDWPYVTGNDGQPVRDPQSWLTWGVKGPFATQWPLLWPHWPGQAVALVLPDLRKEVEHEPTSFEPSVTVPLLEWLTQPAVAVGDWTGGVLAFALGSRVALHRAAAVDAVLGLHHGGRFGDVPLVACVLAAGEAGVIKLGRVAQCLAELLPAAPALTRDLALELLPSLIEGGHKETHRFLTLAADAVATAGKVELPAAVVDAAGRKGSSKLVTEARRLVAL